MRLDKGAYRKTVRVTITGLHGKGLTPSKGLLNVEGLQNIEKLDFVEEFFHRRELKVHQSQSESSSPQKTIAASRSNQPSAPLEGSEARTIAKDAPEDSTTSPYPPSAAATVGRPGGAKDQVAVQDDLPPEPPQKIGGKELWIRDFPQSIPHWGGVSDLLFS